MPLGADVSQTFWEIAVGMGAVVVIVVVVLLTLLLRFVTDIRDGALEIFSRADDAAADAALLGDLGTTGDALQSVKSEAVLHLDLLPHS